MVAARTLDDADDIAAVLHERVDRWIHATPVRRQPMPDRIVGLFPTVDAPDDPDMQQALLERRRLIEQRTRDLSEQALDRQEPWLALFGHRRPSRSDENTGSATSTPSPPTVRWGIASRTVLGEEPTSLEQAADLDSRPTRGRGRPASNRPRQLTVRRRLSAQPLPDPRRPEL